MSQTQWQSVMFPITSLFFLCACSISYWKRSLKISVIHEFIYFSFLFCWRGRKCLHLYLFIPQMPEMVPLGVKLVARHSLPSPMLLGQHCCLPEAAQDEAGVRSEARQAEPIYSDMGGGHPNWHLTSRLHASSAHPSRIVHLAG